MKNRLPLSVSLSVHPFICLSFDFHRTVQNLFGFLWVDLHSTTLFNRQLLGRLSIPLYSIRHSNKVSIASACPSLCLCMFVCDRVCSRQCLSPWIWDAICVGMCNGMGVVCGCGVWVWVWCVGLGVVCGCGRGLGFKLLTWEYVMVAKVAVLRAHWHGTLCFGEYM